MSALNFHVKNSTVFDHHQIFYMQPVWNDHIEDEIIIMQSRNKWVGFILWIKYWGGGGGGGGSNSKGFFKKMGGKMT